MLKRYIKQHLEKVFGVRVLFVWEKISSFFFYSWIFFFLRKRRLEKIYIGGITTKGKRKEEEIDR